MNNGKSLSLEIPNFLEEENSPATRKIKRLEKEVLAKQKEINFHSKQATNYCERLQSLEVELKDKDQQISGLKSVIQQLKEETSKLLTEKDQQISVLTRELQDSRLVSDLLETDNTWRVKRNSLLKILLANLPRQKIKEKFGDIEQGWEDDIVLQVLTKEDKHKLAVYEKLEVKDLPPNWKEQLTKLQDKLQRIRKLKCPQISVK